MFHLDIIGYIAGVLGIGSLLPQLIKCWRTKSTEDLSIWRYVVYILSLILWIVYGVMISNGPLIAVCIVTLIIAILILYFAIKYK